MRSVRAALARATAAGVPALVDFPEPTRRESLAPGEAFSAATHQSWQEDSRVADGQLQFDVTASQQEKHATADGPFSLQVVFDTTRLDWSHAG